MLLRWPLIPAASACEVYFAGKVIARFRTALSKGKTVPEVLESGFSQQFAGMEIPKLLQLWIGRIGGDVIAGFSDRLRATLGRRYRFRLLCRGRYRFWHLAGSKSDQFGSDRGSALRVNPIT